MSNSDNHNSTDKKLDRLYGLTQDSESPPDLDSSLMAAARAAIESEEASSTAFWKNRYGWATAATLLLTATLFISVTDNSPPKSADAFTSSVENTRSVESVIPDPTGPTVPELGASAEDLEAQVEWEQPRLRQQQHHSSAAKSEAKRAPLNQLARPAIAASCQEYPKLLIDRVCWFAADDEAMNWDQFRLYASKTSDCAGQSLQVRRSQGAPTPHPSSTAQRFVIDRKDPVSDSAQDSIACVAGKLERQSLARGR